MKRCLEFVTSLFVSYVLICFITAAVSAQTTAFFYQGHVKDQGLPATGVYDFEFRLFADASGGSALNTLQRTGVSVDQGLFSVTLDFGVFPTADRYIEIAVKSAGSTAFETLLPRNPVLSTPRSTLASSAVTATTAANAQTLNGIGPSGFIRNSSALQPSSNFNISGTGFANIFDAQNHFRIGGERVIGINGFQNVFVGTRAGNSNMNGTENTFVGIDAGMGNSAASGNSFFGAESGVSNTGGGNSFFGRDTGKVNEGHGNSFFGDRAGEKTTTGGANSFFGTNAGVWNTTGGLNVFIGGNTAFFNTTGNSNVFVGTSSALNNSTGSENVFLGLEAGSNNRTGNMNTFIGSRSGMGNLDGSENTTIGTFSMLGGQLTNATAIGSRAQVSRSNSLVLGGITGVNHGTDTNVGIGTTAPKAKLHIAGGSLYLSNPQTLIMTSPNGSCWAISVADNGTLSSTSTPCPQ